MDDQRISNAGIPHKYFHIMLHMADDDLDPYQYRLLGHYVRVCGGGGVCFESTQTTATKTKMSAGKVCSTRRELAALGYITIVQPEAGTLKITLEDRWGENVARYSKTPPPDEGVHGVNGHSPGERGVHGVNGGRSPGEPKKNQKEEESSKEEPTQEDPPTPTPDGAKNEDDEKRFQSILKQVKTENLIAPTSTLGAEKVRELFEGYGGDALEDALAVSIANNARALTYVEAVLRNRRKEAPTPLPPSPDEVPDYGRLADERLAVGLLSGLAFQVDQWLNGHHEHPDWETVKAARRAFDARVLAEREKTPAPDMSHVAALSAPETPPPSPLPVHKEGEQPAYRWPSRERAWYSPYGGHNA